MPSRPREPNECPACGAVSEAVEYDPKFAAPADYGPTRYCGTPSCAVFMFVGRPPE